MLVICILKGLGVVDVDYFYYFGMLGMYGIKVVNLVVQECDLLIVVGVCFDDCVIGKFNIFVLYVKVIYMDIDLVELNKLCQVYIGLIGDLNCLLLVLQQLLVIDGWCEWSVVLCVEYVWCYDYFGEVIYVLLLLKQFFDCKLVDSVVIIDVGQYQMWLVQYMIYICLENFIIFSGLGIMGFGLLVVVGVQVVCFNDMVICIFGDGFFMMNVQELGIVKCKQLLLKIVLFDNQWLGMV